MNFNIIRRIVKLITGYERKNRLSLKIGPSEASDAEVASQLTGLIMPMMENDGGHAVISDAFEMGALVPGMNLIEPYLNRKELINFKRRAYNKFLLDPNFTDRTLKDCSYLITHEEGMLTADIQSLLPGKERMIKQYAKLEGGNEKMPFTAYKGPDKAEGKRANYSEFWERSTRKAKLVGMVSPQQQQPLIFEWQGDNKDLPQIKAKGESIGIKVSIYDDYIDSVKFSALVNGRCVFKGTGGKGQDPAGIDDYPHVLVAGFFYPEYDSFSAKLQGEVRPLRDPQREVSKRMSKVLDIIDSQISTGMMAEVGALVDEDQINATGQGQGIMVNEGKWGKVQQLQMGDVPPGLFKLNQDLQSFVTLIAGVNESVFGNDDISKQLSGYLMKLRQGAGLVALQDLFDNLRGSKKQLCFKLCKMLQKNYSRAKIKRIINREPAANFYTDDLSLFDLTPQEGILTETQTQQFYVELLHLKQAGFNIPEEVIIENAPVQFKQKVKDAILKAAQQAREIQMQQLRDKQLTDQGKAAKIKADLGRAAERNANVAAHQADAKYKQAKTVKEMQNMDFDKMMRLLEFFQANRNSSETAITKR